MMEIENLHGSPSKKGRPIHRFIGYTDGDRKKIHDWMDKVQPRGFTDMVPKGITPLPPEVHPIFEVLYIEEAEDDKSYKEVSSDD